MAIFCLATSLQDLKIRLGRIVIGYTSDNKAIHARDIHAVTCAHNLLAAMVDNHLHHGNALGLDSRRILWKRVLDMNDRALRDITVGLGGTANGYPRQDGFDIVVASEVMAWKSPVKCRLMSSIGTTCAYPPPAAPPFMPNDGPSDGSRRQIIAFLPM